MGSSNSLPLGCIEFLYVISEHRHVSLNDLDVAKERFHCSLVNSKAHLLLTIDILQLWNFCFHEDLIVKDLKFIGVEGK